MRIVTASLIALLPQAPPALPAEGPLHRLVELRVGESAEVELWNGEKARLKLLEVQDRRDPFRAAVRDSWVRVEVNGREITLGAGGYRLPASAAGVQIDCPVTNAWAADARHDYWGLRKDARFRLWPAGSPWARPGSFVYPVRQRWFASATHMGNEPCFMDGGEERGPGRIYYHYGLDLSGCEHLVDGVAVADGVVVGARGEIQSDHQDAVPPHGFGADQVLLRDAQGWYHRYAHFAAIEPAVQLGRKVHRGQKLGTMGKTGGTSWSHIHLDMRRREPDGRWVLEDAYAFLWEAYRREYGQDLLAVARPHHLVAAGEKAVLDGSRSWGVSPLVKFEWTFTDGTTAEGARVERSYARPGFYTETLKVTDAEGRVAYDFGVVQVFDPESPRPAPATIHATYAPTFGIQPGDPVTFKVRTFGSTHGQETWDFGDGTAPVTVRSDGGATPQAPDGYAVTTHAYARPGRYFVKVERTDARGAVSTARLQVHVGEPRRPSRPFGGKPHPIPGTIETENFDEGEMGVAYDDADAKNNGAPYRATGVDIEPRPSASNGYNLGWTRPGEWLTYTVEVREAGVYAIEMDVACHQKGGTFHLEFDGKDVTGPIQIPDTGGWEHMKPIRHEGVRLSAGTFVMKVRMDTPGARGSIGDIDYFRFVR
jgi:murein DD-endopeptidase MepM/ murein hydrolase activator NlpD